MKAMTCRQMGGFCDAKISGETAEEMVENGTKHLNESTEPEDAKAKAMMDSMTEEDQAKWMDNFKQKFDQLPESE